MNGAITVNATTYKWQIEVDFRCGRISAISIINLLECTKWAFVSRSVASRALELIYKFPYINILWMKSSQELRVRENTIESAQHTKHTMQIKIYMPYVCLYIYTYIFMNMIKIQLVCEKSNVLGGRRQLPSTVVSLFFAVLPSLSADKDGNGIHSQKPSQESL